MLGIGRSGPLGPARLVAEAGPSAPGAGRTSSASRDRSLRERDALTVLAGVTGLGPVTLARLVAASGSAVALVTAAAARDGARRVLDLARSTAEPVPNVSPRLAAAIAHAADRAPVTLERLHRAGIRSITLDDDTYPPRLRAIELPPVVLFVQGDESALSARRAVAVVGTRTPTAYGRHLAAHLAAQLSGAGATVVSGLALGIDGAAHDGVVAVGGRTVAVLGGGHARLYPGSHARLAGQIVASHGAVVSEHPPDMPPARWTFPRRNRIISGLAEATVVVEAGRRSGALTTAMWALEQGRGCFVVPGAIGAPRSAGCLDLLRECSGEARVVAGVAELLADLDLPGEGDAPNGPADPARQGGAPVPSVAAVLLGVGEAARLVGRALVAGNATPDDLMATTDLPVATVLAALTVLEERGLAASAYGRYRPAGLLAAAAAPGQASTRRRHR